MIRDFFRLIWPVLPDGEWHQPFFLLPAKLGFCIQASRLGEWSADDEAALAADNRAGQNVYYGLGLLSRAPLPGERAKKQDVAWMPGIGVDLDVRRPGAHQAQNLAPTKEAALEVVAEVADFGLEPTLVVDTGHGIQLLHLFDCPMDVRDIVGRRRCERLAEAIQEVYRAAAGKRGWLVDRTVGVERVWRLPGTLNVKIPDQPAPALLLSDEGVRQACKWSEEILGIGSSVTTTPPPPQDHQKQASPPAGGPEAPPVEPWTPAALQALLERLRQHPSPLVKALLAGQSLADRGDRDNAYARACYVVARAALETGQVPFWEDVAEIFAPSLSVWAGELDAKLTLEEELAKGSAKFDSALAKLEVEVSHELAVGRGIARAAEANERRQRGRFEAAAARQGVAPELFPRYLVIQAGGSFYVHDGTRYKSSITQQELMQSLPRDWEALEDEGVVDFWVEKADGSGSRRKSVAEILGDYCTACRRVEASLILQESRYDPKTEVFHEAVCPRRDLRPEFSPEVDVWLRLLFGPEAERCHDWVTTSPDLDRQTCALYLCGASASGKTMLAHGVARIWTTGGPTELQRVLGDGFNEDLVRCPLVVADEQVPRSRGGGTTAKLRDLIGSSSRTLARKYRPNASLVGAVRLMLLANNDRLLEGEGEDLSEEDIRATAGRFYIVRARPAAAEYLRQLGGYKGTADWVEGDRIARHVLWLHENRRVEAGGRFLVEGRPQQAHQRLATQSGWAARVCEWLVGYLLNPNAIERSVVDMVRCGNGELLVRGEALSASWPQYVRSSDRPPTLKQICLTLRNLAERQERIENKRFYPIRVEWIMDWADEMNLDVEKMWRTIRREVVFDAEKQVA